MASPTTHASLLVRIRDAEDSRSWNQFLELYTPIVIGYCRKRGLQDADAADVAQDVMQTVARRMPEFEYDRSSGPFRGWLFTVTRNKLIDFVNKQRRQPRGTGQTIVHRLLEEHPSPEEQQQWDQQEQQRLFDWAAEQVRSEFSEKTWRAFWRTAVENEAAKTVAENVGISVGAVYIAKSRVLARLREKIREITDETKEK